MQKSGERLASDGWRYVRDGTVRHMTREGLFNNEIRVSLCHKYGGPMYWHGTGSQEEYDRLAELRACKSCGSLSE